MTNTSSPRQKSRASTAPTWPSGAPSPASRGVHDGRHDDGLFSRRPAAAEHGGSPRAPRGRPQAHRHPLPLLGFFSSPQGDILNLLLRPPPSSRAHGGGGQ